MKIGILPFICLVLFEDIDCCAARNSGKHRIDHNKRDRQRCEEIRQRIGHLSTEVSGASSFGLAKHSRRRLEREEKLLERMKCDRILTSGGNVTASVGLGVGGANKNKLTDRIKLTDKEKANTTRNNSSDKENKRKGNKAVETNKIAERQETKKTSTKGNVKKENTEKKNKVQNKQTASKSPSGLPELNGQGILQGNITNRQQTNATSVVKEAANRNKTMEKLKAGPRQQANGTQNAPKQSAKNSNKISEKQQTGNATRGAGAAKKGNKVAEATRHVERHQTGRDGMTDRQNGHSMLKTKSKVKRQAYAYPTAAATTVAAVTSTTAAETTTTAAETTTTAAETTTAAVAITSTPAPTTAAGGYSYM